MPILPIALQRRHAELGRIRLGVRTPTSNGRTRPDKLDRFRFTSPHERHVRDLAALYGGAPAKWDNGGRGEWEVISDATSVPVVVVRGGMSQWLETWSGGGCTRRCDGQRETLSDLPCLCAAESDNDRTCKPTTRLSVMLAELGAIGVWRLESHGWNAAAELPSMVDLAQHVADLVPARLLLAERVQVRDGKTSRFVVPTLDLQVSPSDLTAIVSGRRPVDAAGPGVAGGRPALEAAAVDWVGLVADATTVGEVRALWEQAKDAGALDETLADALTARARDVAAAPAPAGDVGSTGAVDGGAAAAVWAEVVAAAGAAGMTTTALTAAVEAHTGAPPSQATADQLRGFLDTLRDNNTHGLGKGPS